MRAAFGASPEGVLAGYTRPIFKLHGFPKTETGVRFRMSDGEADLPLGGVSCAPLSSRTWRLAAYFQPRAEAVQGWLVRLPAPLLTSVTFAHHESGID